MGSRIASGAKVGVLGLVGLAAGATKMAVDFDQSMTMIATQAGAPAKEVDRLKEKVLDLASASEFSPDELAQGLFRVESAGFRGAEAMQVLNKAQLLADVGNADLEETTYALTAAMRSGIKGTEDMGTTVGVLNAAVGQGNMRMEDLTGALSTGVLPAAKAFGLSITDVTSALDVMTRAGTPAQAAATRLRMTFSLMAAPSEAASDALKGIGLDSDSLAIEMRKPDGLLKALLLLREHLSGLSKVEQAQVISDIFGGGRTSAGIMTLIQNTGQLGDVLDATGRKAGNFNKAVGLDNATAASRFAEIWAGIQAQMVRLGEKILPTVEEGLDILSDPALSGGEKFSKLLDMLVPKAIDAGVDVGKGFITGIVRGWWEMDALSKLFTAAAIIRVVGGKGAILGAGGVVGRLLGVGVAATTATTVATGAGAAAAGGGLIASMRAKVLPFAKRVGLAGVGIALADGVIGEFGRRSAQSSGDLFEELEKATGPGSVFGTMFDWYDQTPLADLTGGFTIEAEQAAAKMGPMVTAIATGTKQITDEEARYLLQLGRQAELTSAAQAELEQMVETAQEIPRGPAKALKSLSPTEIRKALGAAQILGITDETIAQLKSRLKGVELGVDLAKALDMGDGKVRQVMKKYRKQFETLPPAAQQAAIDSMRKLAKGLEERGLLPEGAAKKLVKRLRDQLDEVPDSITSIMGAAKKNAEREIGGMDSSINAIMGGTTKKGKKHAGDFNRGVSGAFKSAAQAVGGAIEGIIGDASGALEALGFEGVSFSSKKKGKGKGTHGDATVPGAQTGGNFIGTVPGAGSGDKVRMVLDTEPGEDLFVLNRTASRERRELLAWNEKVPRFQGGGLTGGPFQSQADVLGAGPGFIPYMNLMNSMFGPQSVISGYRPGDPLNHGKRLAVDVATPGIEGATAGSPASGAAEARMDAMFNWNRQHIGIQSEAGLDLLWETLVGGNHYNHMHRGMQAPYAMDAQRMMQFLSGLPGGGSFEQIKKWIVSGPEGPVLDIAQGAVDQVWKGADKLLARKSRTQNFGATDMGDVHGGQFSSTAYGPPWGGINGTGITATGVDLMNSPHIFGVAVDPSVIPLGSKMQISPNPFNTGSAFKAFDTGGAILGNRIDFYDWRGREEQMGWGTRPVNVEGFAQGGLLKGAGDPAGGDGAGLLKPILKRLRKDKSIKKLVSKLKGLGLDPELQGKVDELTAEYEKFAEYAGYAGDRTVVVDENNIGEYPGAKIDDVIQGTFREGTEEGWLKQEFETLFRLRNKLLAAEAEITKARDQMNDAIEDARRRLEKIRAEHKKLEQALRDVKGDSKEARAKRAAIRDDMAKLDDEGSKIRDKVMPVLTKQRDKLSERRGLVLDTLTTVQGTDGPMHEAAVLPVKEAVTQFGGEIFTVARRLIELGSPAIASDPTAGSDLATARADILEDLLRESNQRLAVYQAQNPVLNNFPYVGEFAKGGVAALVGETGPEIAHFPSGTRVHSAADTQAMLAPQFDIHVNGDIVQRPGDTRPPIEVKPRDRRRETLDALRGVGANRTPGGLRR